MVQLRERADIKTADIVDARKGREKSDRNQNVTFS